MKKIYLIFTVILSFSLMACSPTSIKTGRYVMENTEIEEWSWIDISEGNQYEFNRYRITIERSQRKVHR